MICCDSNRKVNRSGIESWLAFILAVFCIKFLLYMLDPVPGFFFGDSGSYILTALTGWTPQDRSFTYGYLVHLTAVRANSFSSLITAQIFASVGSTILLTYTLERFFRVRRNVAFALGILFAIEPIQLVYERFVMTECFSLFIFACYALLALQYIQTHSWKPLVLLPPLGIALVSLRVSFLPIVQVYTITLPFLAALAACAENSPPSLWLPFNLERGLPAGRMRLLCVVGLHVFISFCLTLVIHTGYRHLFGRLSGGEPGYNLRNGLFLLAAWAPVVEPEDFPYPELRGTVFGNLVCDYKDRAARPCQRFREGGSVRTFPGCWVCPMGTGPRRKRR